MREHAIRRARPLPPSTAPPRTGEHPLTALQRSAGNTAVAGSLQRDAIPGFSQTGDTCQPASLLTAFLIWDRERASPGTPNRDMISACDAVAIHLNANRAALDTRLTAAEVGRIEGLLTRTRALLATPTGAINEGQYQELATALARLFDSTDAAARVMGFALVDRQYDTLGEIFGSPELSGLTPGQIAQVEWYVHTRVIQNGQAGTGTGYHVFLVGRKGDGTWFLSDQGQSPAVTLRAPDLGSLRAALDAAAASGRSWIDTRPTSRRIPLTWTGVHILSSPAALEPRHRALLPPGVAIGMANTGWSLSRNVPVVTWDWVGMADSLAGARGLFASSGFGHGFVVFELPQGMFNVVKTNPVSSAAVSGTFEPGGPLASSPRGFVHVWVQMRTVGTSPGTAWVGVY